MLSSGAAESTALQSEERRRFIIACGTCRTFEVSCVATQPQTDHYTRNRLSVVTPYVTLSLREAAVAMFGVYLVA